VTGRQAKILEAVERCLPQDQFASVMRGLGRIALAISAAEAMLDQIGCHLTGRAEAYRTLTQGMALSAKSEVVRTICIEMIADTPLREKAARFCHQLKWMSKERDELLLSICAIPGVAQPLGPRKIAPTTATATEIADLATRLSEQVELGYEITSLLPNSGTSS
jgi:hypothetical protein